MTIRSALMALLIAAAAAASAWQSTAPAQVLRPDLSKTKSSDGLRIIFREVVAAADKSTVSVMGDVAKDKTAQVALGTVVAADGYILTKASEVLGRDVLQVMIAGKPVPAKVVGVSEPQDLAMLKIDAAGLQPVSWADLKSEKVEVGEWVASAGAAPPGAAGDEPIAVGVVSVGRRKIAGRNGFLGVQLAPAEGAGAKILQVIPDSSAEKAGLRVDDVITAVNGKEVKDTEALINAMHEYRPGDVVTLSVKRGKEAMLLKASLGANAGGTSSRFNMMNLMGGPTSKRSSDFTAVFQHDTVLRPADCGGPLVDLGGKVIGINIARAGRTETYALPADIIVPLIEPLKNGKLAPVNANTPGPLKAGEKATTMPGHGE